MGGSHLFDLLREAPDDLGEFYALCRGDPIEVQSLFLKPGQIIARVYTIFDEELEPVRSTVDGIVLTITRKPFVVAGDSIIQIGIP